MNEPIRDLIDKAAEAVANADAILIGAGAGMGVDSGLPEFRGNEGFWNAYPPFRDLNLSFVDLANPALFSTDPEQAWGFFGHRLNLYRETIPHEGFSILSNWSDAKKHGAFVYTSNVDGQFQTAGFEESHIFECHGSIHHLQCSEPCTREIWPSEGERIDVDERTFKARGELPTCRYCGATARPNTLLYGDFAWLYGRSSEQRHSYEAWKESVDKNRLVVVECGAGTGIPTVRYECENAGGTLIRINPGEPYASRGGIGLPLSALDALSLINEALGRL